MGTNKFALIHIHKSKPSVNKAKIIYLQASLGYVQYFGYSKPTLNACIQKQTFHSNFCCGQ